MVSSNTLTGKDWYERGVQLKSSGDFTGALDAYRRSIKCNPRVAAPWIGLAQLLDSNSQFEDARLCLIQAVNADPANLVAHQQLASSHQRLGFVDDAMGEYEKALALAPDSAATHFGKAQLLEDIGQPLQAAAAYRTVLKYEPKHVEALACLLGLCRYLDISFELKQAQDLLPKLGFREKALLGYGMGKAYQHQKLFDAAFYTYTVANMARREVAGAFNRKDFDARIDKMIEIFSPDFFQARCLWGNPNAQPIFIVGLPRSGTTLTEQILASHNQCFGAGELSVMSDLATGTPDLLGDANTCWPHCATRLSTQQCADIGAKYISNAGHRAGDSILHVIDKQPLNFWHLGLIAIALPNARIVHCTRDIRDCGFSIFTQNFSLQQNWSTDLDDIAYYWQGYRRLMQHWKSVTGLQILDVAYEETVTDLEGQARRLLDFIGLPWDDSVMQFHQSDRAVQTPSRWQVRQPLYQTSLAQWRSYERHLSPLIEAVEAG